MRTSTKIILSSVLLLLLWVVTGEHVANSDSSKDNCNSSDTSRVCDAKRHGVFVPSPEALDELDRLDADADLEEKCKNEEDILGRIKHCSDLIALTEEHKKVDKTGVEEDEQAAAYSNRGLAYSATGDYEHAIDDLDRAVLIRPATAYYYITRSKILDKKGDAARASADRSRAAEISGSK